MDSELKIKVEMIKADISKEDQVVNLVSATSKKFGSIDILVNLVGGHLGGKGVTELDVKDWDNMMDLNLKSSFLISKHVLRLMKAFPDRQGKIVHVSSRTGLKSDGYDSAYAAKSALIRFVESIAEEVKQDNINVNCILLGIIDTEPNRKSMPKADFSECVQKKLENVILFLCTEEAKVINGAATQTYGLS